MATQVKGKHKLQMHPAVHGEEVNFVAAGSELAKRNSRCGLFFVKRMLKEVSGRLNLINFAFVMSNIFPLKKWMRILAWSEAL